MFNKNNIPFGILIGLVLPVISILLFEFAFPDLVINGKRGIQYLIVVALNLIILRYFAKKHSDRTSQGIMMVTFVFMLLIFIFRFKA